MRVALSPSNPQSEIYGDGTLKLVQGAIGVLLDPIFSLILLSFGNEIGWLLMILLVPQFEFLETNRLVLYTKQSLTTRILVSWSAYCVLKRKKKELLVLLTPYKESMQLAYE